MYREIQIMNKHIYALLGGVILLPVTATAVPLSGVGVTDYPITGTTVAARPELAGTVVEDLVTPFTISGAGETLSGTIQNRVVLSVDGTYDFYWRILPDSGQGDISAFRVDGFDGFALDADWRIDGLGDVAPDIARYFGDGTGAVNFLFTGDEVGNDVTGGGYEESMFFFLDTDATAYNFTGQFDLLCADNGCLSEVYNTWAPAVPIPAAVWLFGSGLLGLIGVARKKKA